MRHHRPAPHTTPRAASRRAALFAAATAVALLATACSGGEPDDGGKSPGGVRLPPAHAGFDYQIGGPYTPPDGVRIVARDHGVAPARGLYNICYVNAFQAQPGAEDEWDKDLLLTDRSGRIAMDKDWNEAILDISTPAKRARIAKKVGGWIDDCAAKGYDAVEPDNYDSYARAPKGRLTPEHAKEFLKALAAHAHAKGLAIGQKNTPELAPDRKRVGLDFAVAEECGTYDECDDYVEAFGSRVLAIEYTEKGLRAACEGWDDEISVVRRDLNVVPKGKAGYVYRTCDDV
ncbi:endo alpha-1,4 polygalactosaminidase [Streptomyces sp. NPDC001941]|uniref:endo alpha-1,4 polygalactosaminidase n=1 Tax=Streptomyces sp. NPDC001941 TaxID=3154659 RepID=UPI00332CE2AF